MELAQILRELGRHRVWLAVGAVIAILAGVLQAYPPTLHPSPGLKKKSLELGAADTSVVIDSRTSTIIDLKGDVEALAARAESYARLGGSEPVRSIIAKKLGVSTAAIEASTPAANVGSEKRGNQINGENKGYRLSFQWVENQPLIDISSQGPNAKAAQNLANAAAVALRQYTTKQQNAQGVPGRRRVTVRQVGVAEGGVINSGVNVVAAILTGLAALVGFCLLLLFVTRTRTDLRRARVSEADTSWSGLAPDGGTPPGGNVVAGWEPDEAERVAGRR